ncbi:hypothetical protein KKA47_05330 [bacterium]|nr:hypothetical protein [bacterium]
MNTIEYYLKKDDEEMYLGTTVLENSEDEDDAFPRFLQESYYPFKNFKDIFAGYYYFNPDLRPTIDYYSYNSPGEDLSEAIESDMEDLQYLFESLINDGFSLSAINEKTRAEYILAFHDSRDPIRFHGRETTLKFLGCSFVPAH